MSLNDVQLLLADVAIIIILARLLGIAARRLGQPPVLGEILAGILLGPTFFHGRITTTLFPASLDLPADRAGRHRPGPVHVRRRLRGGPAPHPGPRAGRLQRVHRLGRPAPGLGSGLGVWLAHRNHLHHVSTFALFIGTAMAATAFPVLARILTDRGMHRTRIGGLALASAAVADVLAWSLLAVVVALAGSSPQWRVLLAIPYAAVMFAGRPAPAAAARARLPAGGPAHPERPGHRAGRAAAVLLCHQLDGPALHLRRVPVRGRHAQGGRPRAARGNPRPPGADQRPGAAPDLFRRGGAEHQPVHDRALGAGGARRDPGGRDRREAGSAPTAAPSSPESAAATPA